MTIKEILQNYRTIAVVGDLYRFLATGDETNGKLAMRGGDCPSRWRCSSARYRRSLRRSAGKSASSSSRWCRSNSVIRNATILTAAGSSSTTTCSRGGSGGTGASIACAATLECVPSDATTLNTLWVDKNLRAHGLIQAFSRTNRILNSVKTYGNIVSFRDLEQETNDAIALFGNKDARGIVLLRPYGEYYGDYADKVSELLARFPLAARVTGEGKDSLADGESVDWFISRNVNPPGVEPLRLFRTVARNPAILERFRTTGAYILNFGRIEAGRARWQADAARQPGTAQVPD